MRFSKSLAAVVLAGSMLSGSTAYAIGGDGKPMISDATCKEMVSAANAGKPVKDPTLLHTYDKLPSYLADGTLDYFVPANFPYRAELGAAVKEWNEALGGKVVLREVKTADADTINIRYAPDPNALTLAVASVPNKEMIVYVAFADYPESIRSTIAHEFGHLLGVRHTCDYTLMAASQHRHPANHITPTDVAGVIQGQFD